MKQILSIPTHSFVDMITNSSSELFVCDTSKTIDMAKEILRELGIIYNKKQLMMENPNLIYLDKLFTDIFKEPSISKYNFEKIYNLNLALGNDIGFDNIITFSSDNPLEQEKRIYKQKVWAWEKANPRPKSRDEDVPKYNLWWKSYNKARYDIWKPFGETIFNGKKSRYKDVCQALKDICSDNNINPKELGALKVDWEYGHIEIKFNKNASKKIQDFRAALLHHASWGMCPKKGNLIIESVSDNTIPYDMFEDIKQIFSANRHHLG